MISIIIPVYNRLDLLKEAAASVLQQVGEEFELVIVDDGSETGENPEQLIHEMGDQRIRLISLPHSGYPGLARNRGAEAAQGEYLAFLDSDDLWLPGKLEKQMSLSAADPELTIVHTRERWLRGELEVSQKGQRHRRSGDIFQDALWKCIIGPSTVMVKAETFSQLGGFREDLEIAEDYELWLRWTACHPVGYIDEPLIIKRAGQCSQLSEKYGQIEKFRIEGLLDLVEQKWFLTHSSPQRQREAELMLSKKCGIYSNGARKRGREGEAVRFFDLAEQYR